MAPPFSDDVWRAFFTEARVLGQRREAPGSPIARLLEQSVKKARVTSGPAKPRPPAWDARRFRLDTSSVFTGWPAALQTAVLEALSDHSLATSVFIEKGAVTYCARMALEAETIEEKALFMVMGHEEVVHLLEFERLLPAHLRDAAPSRFITQLNQFLQLGDRMTGVLVAQVLLEGMAMQHYETLRGCCVDDDTTQVLERVLHDEARHHGSGLVLLDRAPVTAAQVAHMAQVAGQVVTMIGGQGQALLGVLRAKASEAGLPMGDDVVATIAQEIDLAGQMRERTQSVRDAVHKLKRPELHPLLAAVDAACA